VFDAYRDAMQRTAPLGRLYFSFSHSCLFQRLVCQYRNECIELLVELFNTLETGVYNFYRRYFLRPNGLAQGCDIYDLFFYGHGLTGMPLRSTAAAGYTDDFTSRSINIPSESWQPLALPEILPIFVEPVPVSNGSDGRITARVNCRLVQWACAAFQKLQEISRS